MRDTCHREAAADGLRARRIRADEASPRQEERLLRTRGFAAVDVSAAGQKIRL